MSGFDVGGRRRAAWIRDGERWRLERERRYGDSLVEAEAAHRIFREFVGPAADGYTEIRRGTHVKSVSTELFHLLEWRQGKTSYNLFWGVSLTYMPHSWEKTVQLHRTLKSARFDLHEAAMDYVVDHHATWDRVWSVSVDHWHGPECYRTDLERVWGLLQEPVGGWLDGVTTLEGVAARAREQAERQWTGAGAHHPDPRLVLAFTQAKQGDREALATFDSFRAIVREPTSYERLGAALRTLLSSSAGPAAT